MGLEEVTLRTLVRLWILSVFCNEKWKERSTSEVKLSRSLLWDSE
jgi:hypothetical protein